jgi:hypothetical protein
MRAIRGLSQRVSGVSGWDASVSAAASLAACRQAAAPPQLVWPTRTTVNDVYPLEEESKLYHETTEKLAVFNANCFDSISEDGECAIIVKVELAAGTVVSWLLHGFGIVVYTYLAMFLCTKMSPGLEAVMTDSGTRESEQPIQRI